MEITTFFDHGGPGLEVSLGVDHGQALVEAVNLRANSLCSQGRYDELTAQDNEILDRSPGAAIELRIGDSDSVIRDLENFHSTTFSVINAIIDGRRNSQRSKWKIDARERLRMGRTALKMADMFRAVQFAHDGDIIDEIDALGVYESLHPDAGTIRRPFRSCRSNQQHANPPVCGYVSRRQRRSYRKH
jgi:hypothetical protein